MPCLHEREPTKRCSTSEKGTPSKMNLSPLSPFSAMYGKNAPCPKMNETIGKEMLQARTHALNQHMPPNANRTNRFQQSFGSQHGCKTSTNSLWKCVYTHGNACTHNMLFDYLQPCPWQENGEMGEKSPARFPEQFPEFGCPKLPIMKVKG